MTWVDLVLPCRDEAAALEQLLPTVPSGIRAIVVDNGSSDETAAVARRLGAHVVTEPEPGYGAAIAAGLAEARTDVVAFADGDGSFDLAQVIPLVEAVAAGGADMAAGRRRPMGRGAWPWHARLGNSLVVGWLRHRTNFPLRDLAPMRACRRAALVELGVKDRRFGYPVELFRRATEAGWTFREFDVDYRPRTAGTKSKVSGSIRGTWRTARDFRRALS